MTAPKKRPSARYGRDGTQAPKPPLKITYKDVESEFKANLAAMSRAAEIDDQDEYNDDDESFRDRVLDHVRQKSVDFMRFGDKRGEELMDELHRELERLQ